MLILHDMITSHSCPLLGVFAPKLVFTLAIWNLADFFRRTVFHAGACQRHGINVKLRECETCRPGADLRRSLLRIPACPTAAPFPPARPSCTVTTCARRGQGGAPSLRRWPRPAGWGARVSGRVRCRHEMPGEVAEFGQDMEDAAQTWGLGGGGAEAHREPPCHRLQERAPLPEAAGLCVLLPWAAARLGPPIPVHGSFCLTQEVPDPTKYFVTRWSTDPWIQMAYSFVKTGGSGEAYDIIAEEIQGTVFFAGEVRVRSLNPAALAWVTFFSRKGCTSRVAERRAHQATGGARAAQSVKRRTRFRLRA